MPRKTYMEKIAMHDQRIRAAAAGEMPWQDWKPYRPKPLPLGIQERIDAYRAIPSLGVKCGFRG